MVRINDIGILADDLTGACDVAACFTPVVGPVVVRVSPDAAFDHEAGLEVLNTQTRLLSSAAGKSVVQAVGRELTGKPIVFKKIDTALRGPVGAELQGLLEALGLRKVIVAPALPRIGKTTRQGIQYDQGIPINKTVYATDPASPVDAADIGEVIARTGKVECQVSDAESDDDLRRIVDLALHEPKVVFAGSLGLATALAERVEKTVRKQARLPSARRIMIVCGSRYERAHAQMEEAALHIGARVLYVHPLEEVNGGRQWVKDEETLLVCLIQRTIADSVYPGPQIIPRFTNIVAQMIRCLAPDGVGLVGGETAFHLLRQLHATGLEVYGRIEEVMPYGLIMDGEMAGRPFVTKGGSVGPIDSLIQMIQILKMGERKRVK